MRAAAPARILLAMVALAGCTASAELSDTSKARAERELAKALAGRTAGEPVDCIRADRSNGPQIIDGDTLLYREMGTVWRNDLPAACPGMQPGDILIVEMFGSQLCSSDRVRAVTPGANIPGPQCRLGKFTPYRK
ncbi:DUF6491 family protein [Sphingomonas canadensis]|uniref:DUF6491 family protein n=1 Tax=Sphingomonas canadensis TaxID=1219257 RepID=A0ABW3H678_9SPHN|nr:DUF6491 family protein [Sphingomonas canadensis]MCW3835885.1 DUF6491 family protein [Sphingomonas canadensis]